MGVRVTARRFTEAEDAAIIDGYRAGLKLQQIGDQIDRQWTSVQARVQVLMRRGALDYGTRSRRPWTADQDQELRGLWGWKSQEQVAKALGRSLTAVQVRAQRLGLSDCWKGAYTCREVGRIFNVDSKTVVIWIERGYLAGKRSRVKCGGFRKWRIEHEAIEAFIRDFQPYYERRRITEPYWRDLADKAWATFDLITVAAAAKRLGVCDETVKRRIRRGDWRAERFACGGGYAWYVRRADLESFAYWHPPVRLLNAKGHAGAIGKAPTLDAPLFNTEPS